MLHASRHELGAALAGCCNANPDPCCHLLCPGEPGPDASVYISCEQGYSQCQALDGNYAGQGDGSFACSVALDAGDAGPTDAAPGDAGPSDAGPGDAEAGP